jgi:hypothetical protein
MLGEFLTNSILSAAVAGMLLAIGVTISHYIGWTVNWFGSWELLVFFVIWIIGMMSAYGIISDSTSASGGASSSGGGPGQGGGSDGGARERENIGALINQGANNLFPPGGR